MAATALYVYSYHLDEAMVCGSFPKLGNCSHEEILKFPSVKESIISSLYTKHSPKMLKFLCVFLCNTLHEMKSKTPEQTKTAPAFHIHIQGRASGCSVIICFSVFSFFFQVFVQIFFFLLSLVFLNKQSKGLKNKSSKILR